MEKQNNIPNKIENQPRVVTPSQTSSINSELPEKAVRKSPHPLIIGIIVGVVILTFGVGGFFLLRAKKTTVDDSTGTIPTKTVQQQKAGRTVTNLESLFSNLEKTYAGNIPWGNIDGRQSYKFYPKEIKGFPLANDEVSTNHDNDYNPIIVVELGDSGYSVPVKNSYVAYYEIPEVISNKYNLDEYAIVFPIQLLLYEFDRKPNENEKSFLSTGQFFKCTNEQAEVRTESFTSENIIVHFCDVNLTSEQRKQVEDRDFHDIRYGIYFINRNLLVELAFDSKYIDIDNSQGNLQDYFFKILNSNDSLFITQNQIRPVEGSREFEEWRRKTFEK